MALLSHTSTPDGTQRVFRDDFDRIATLPEPRWRADDAYLPELLKRIPPDARRALEIGCGTGRATRELAERCERVLGIDLSPRMIQVARQRSSHQPHVKFSSMAVEEFECEPGTFDVILSVATLHHLPLEDSLVRMRNWLAPGGVLLILDLAPPAGFRSIPRRAAALAASTLLRVWHERRLRPPRESRAAWARHGRHDHYHSLADVQRAAMEHLPGALVQPKLLWRYSLTWTAP